MRNFPFLRIVIPLMVAVLCGVSAFSQKAMLTGRVKPIANLPQRSADATPYDKWMRQCDTTEFWTREDLIVRQVLSGNVPDSLRYLHEITFTTPIVDSVPILRKPHTISLWVACDYVSIGNNEKFLRMPMGPLAAQEIADALNCVLPTPLMVDRIHEASQGIIEFFPFRPVSDRNCKPMVFEDSNNAINALMRASGYHFGQFISGLKKDIVITGKLMNNPRYAKNVAIYGWYRLNGTPVQPVHVKHVNYYVDYSHGVRLVGKQCTVDGKVMDIPTILQSPELHRLLSNEPDPIAAPSYAGHPRYILPTK